MAQPAVQHGTVQYYQNSRKKACAVRASPYDITYSIVGIVIFEILADSVMDSRRADIGRSAAMYVKMPSSPSLPLACY